MKCLPKALDFRFGLGAAHMLAVPLQGYVQVSHQGIVHHIALDFESFKYAELETKIDPAESEVV
jgi:hypothetical protein